LFALDVGGVSHGAILAEDENGKEKMENGDVAAVMWLEIVDISHWAVFLAALGWWAQSFQKHRIEIAKLLIMRELIFLGIAKRRKKYRIETGVSGRGALRGILGLRQRRGEFGVVLAAEGELSKIFTNYGSTMRAKLRTVVRVHDAVPFATRPKACGETARY
jgi:hypothetical protein